MRMAIGKVNRVNSYATSTATSNIANTSKNLQTQLLTKQQNLKKLSTDSGVRIEEKEKQRQELEREIEELERRIKQLQLKKETEKVEKEVELNDEVEEVRKENNMDVSTSEAKDKEPKEISSLSAEDAQKILHHNYFLKDTMVEQGVTYDKENKMRILSAEIKQDEMRGFDTTSKKEKLEAMREDENFWADAKNEKQDSSSIINPDAQVIIS